MLAVGSFMRSMFPTTGDQAFLDRARAIAAEERRRPDPAVGPAEARTRWPGSSRPRLSGSRVTLWVCRCVQLLPSKVLLALAGVGLSGVPVLVRGFTGRRVPRSAGEPAPPTPLSLERGLERTARVRDREGPVGGGDLLVADAHDGRVRAVDDEPEGLSGELGVAVSLDDRRDVDPAAGPGRAVRVVRRKAPSAAAKVNPSSSTSVEVCRPSARGTKRAARPRPGGGCWSRRAPRPHRDDRAGPGVERDPVHRGRCDDEPLPRQALAGVPVVPVARGQVDLPRGHAGAGHRGDEQVTTEEVLVVEVPHQRVVLVVEDERSLHRLAGLGGVHERRVDVGQQPVPEPDRGAGQLEHGLTPRPGVLVDVVDLGVVAAEGRERAELHPAQEQLRARVAVEAPDVGAHERLAGDPEARRPW